MCHQMVSYLMEEGQVDLLDSQLAAHQCYQVALEPRHPTGKKAYLEPTNAKE